jgi:hypothetical protein
VTGRLSGESENPGDPRHRTNSPAQPPEPYSRVSLTFLSWARQIPDYVFSIVFVHGLQGHPRKTWTRKATPDPIEQSFEARSGSPHRRIRQLFLRKRNIDSGEAIKTEAVEVFWPLDLLPADCTNTRILTWGYDSNVTHLFGGAANQSNIAAIARDLLFALGRIRLDCVKRSYGWQDMSLKLVLAETEYSFCRALSWGYVLAQIQIFFTD